MRRTFFGSLLGLVACAPGPYVEGPQGAVAWTPGRYELEASVGNDFTATEFFAQLTIAPDLSMSLSASSGLCRDQNQSEVARDMAAGQRTFQCDAAVWTLRPVPGSVRGTIRASVLVERRVQIQCPLGRSGPCYGMQTDRETRTEALRVRALP